MSKEWDNYCQQESDEYYGSGQSEIDEEFYQVVVENKCPICRNNLINYDGVLTCESSRCPSNDSSME